ncbi:PrpF protein [Burkholderiales bacterium]
MTMQTPLQAVYLRGGTSKGVTCRPDPYGQKIDGMGGGTCSTKRVVIEEPNTPRNPSRSSSLPGLT